jgi:hypothetical protein
MKLQTNPGIAHREEVIYDVLSSLVFALAGGNICKGENSFVPDVYLLVRSLTSYEISD